MEQVSGITVVILRSNALPAAAQKAWRALKSCIHAETLPWPGASSKARLDELVAINGGAQRVHQAAQLVGRAVLAEPDDELQVQQRRRLVARLMRGAGGPRHPGHTSNAMLQWYQVGRHAARSGWIDGA